VICEHRDHPSELPAPDFRVTERHTKALLFAHKSFAEMDKQDRLRACYQDAGLMCVTNRHMTNSSLRKRFSISDENYSIASRVIRETIEAGLVRPYDPSSQSKRHARYVPFWA
jgi:predicted HTH transcriptional regulator